MEKSELVQIIFKLIWKFLKYTEKCVEFDYYFFQGWCRNLIHRYKMIQKLSINRNIYIKKFVCKFQSACNDIVSRPRFQGVKVAAVVSRSKTDVPFNNHTRHHLEKSFDGCSVISAATNLQFLYSIDLQVVCRGHFQSSFRAQSLKGVGGFTFTKKCNILKFYRKFKIHFDLN